MKDPGDWECRYFVRRLPSRLSHARLLQLDVKTTGPAVDEDIYLVGADASVNFKVRMRRSTLKAKMRVDRREDGFELWQTEMETRFPLSRQALGLMTTKLRLTIGERQLSSYSTPSTLATSVCAGNPDILCVKVLKRRMFYWAHDAWLEISQVNVGQQLWHTVAVGSAGLECARSFQETLSAGSLRDPTNYVEWCRGLATSRAASVMFHAHDLE